VGAVPVGGEEVGAQSQDVEGRLARRPPVEAPAPPMSRVVDLGSGVTARLVTIDPDAVNVAGERIYPDDAPRGPVGAIVDYGDGCEGVIFWWRRPGEQGPVWELRSLDPLHVEPSVQCATHANHHGWIRGGRWQQA
jgi:hypothetical protein